MSLPHRAPPTATDPPFPRESHLSWMQQQVWRGAMHQLSVAATMGSNNIRQVWPIFARPSATRRCRIPRAPPTATAS
jgi:hypothetical protein